MHYRDELEMYKKALAGAYERKSSVIKESTEEQGSYVVIVEHPAGHRFHSESGDVKVFSDLTEARRLAAQGQLSTGHKCWVAELTRKS